MTQARLTRMDRLIGYFSPSAAVRRAQARTILSYYEATRPNRLHKSRRATGNIDDNVRAAGLPMRQMARYLEQNYDIAAGVLNALVVNVVGAHGIGVEPQPRQLDGSIHAPLARQIMELHTEWCRRPDVTRQYDWASAERMLCRTWFRDGEALGQMLAGTVPGLEHGTRVPFSVELIDPDYLADINREPERGRTAIVQGVEMNAWGAPVAYHLHKANPASVLVGRDDTKRVAAAQIFHVKHATRIRQTRGVSVFANTLNRFDDLKDYEESERIAAKIAASMAAFIKKGSADLYNPEGDENDSPRGMQFRPGMIFDDLRPGEEIGTIDTNRPNVNLELYRDGQMRAIAAGTGPTFSSVSRKYDGTYSAQRQELIEGYATYSTLAREFIARVSRPVFEQFVYAAIASGELRVPAGVRMDTITAAAFAPPAMPWIDPKKEAEAWAILEDRCYASGPEIIRKRGANPMDVLEQQGRWLREKEDEGVPHCNTGLHITSDGGSGSDSDGGGGGGGGGD